MALLFGVSIACVASTFGLDGSFETALKFLEKVAGFNRDSCSLVGGGTNIIPFQNNSQHFQTFIKVIVSNDTTFEALITLTDGKMWDYRLDGKFGMGERTLQDCLTIANRSLEGYRRYFNSSYAGEFARMVSTALQTQSLIVESENSLLKISRVENPSTLLDYREYVTLSWVYKINGYMVPALSFSISVSKTGLVTRFTDNCALYYVASTDVNVSKEEAISMATPYAEAYAQQHGQTIKTVNATLEFVHDIASDRGDIFAIYPQWEVLITFDKRNGDVYGYAVMIWADNGEVYHHGPQGAFYPSSEGSDTTYPFAVIWLFAVVFATIAVFSGLCMYAKRRAKARRGAADEHLL